LPRLANSSFRIRREGRVRNGAAKKIERFLERAIVLFLRRHVGLRARFLSAFRLFLEVRGRCLMVSAADMSERRPFGGITGE
jgi:hypothetical protein